MAAAKARAAQESLAILLLRRSGGKQLIRLTKASSTQNRPAQLDAIGVRLSNEAGVQAENSSRLRRFGTSRLRPPPRNHCRLSLGRISAHMERTR